MGDWGQLTTALPGKHSSGRYMATEEENDKRTLGKRPSEGDVDSRIQVKGWRKMEITAQNRAEAGEEWSVAYVQPERQGLTEVKSHV